MSVVLGETACNIESRERVWRCLNVLVTGISSLKREVLELGLGPPPGLRL